MLLTQANQAIPLFQDVLVEFIWEILLSLLWLPIMLLVHLYSSIYAPSSAFNPEVATIEVECAYSSSEERFKIVMFDLSELTLVLDISNHLDCISLVSLTLLPLLFYFFAVLFFVCSFLCMMRNSLTS